MYSSSTNSCSISFLTSASPSSSALLSPPSSPSRKHPRLYHKKQHFGLQHQASSAALQTIKLSQSPVAALASPPAEGTPQRQPSIIEEEEALLILNISKQRSPTPPPTSLTISPSASPNLESSQLRTSAFSLFTSLRANSPSYEELPAEKLQVAPETPERTQKSTRKRKSAPVTEKEETRAHSRYDGEDYDRNNEVRRSSTNGRKEVNRTSSSKVGKLPSNQGTCNKRRKEEEDGDFQLQEDEEDDSDDCLEDSDEEFVVPTPSSVPSSPSASASKKQPTVRKRSKVSSLLPSYGKTEPLSSSPSEGNSPSLSPSLSPSPSPKGKRDKGLSYLHDLGIDLRSYLAAWLTRHTSVEESKGLDPLYQCIKCIPPAGEQSRVSSSDRHKPGRVRIAIPQQLRKPYLPEKILAYHASSALFGQLPPSDELANLVASHRCGHSWCVAAHHLVWEPLGNKLARERGKQCCVGGEACRHGPLRCFKMNP